MYLCFITDPSGLVYTLGCLSTGQPALPRFRLSATRTKRKPSSLCDTCRLHAILRREADSVYRRRYNAEERCCPSRERHSAPCRGDKTKATEAESRTQPAWRVE